MARALASLGLLLTMGAVAAVVLAAGAGERDAPRESSAARESHEKNFAARTHGRDLAVAGSSSRLERGERPERRRLRAPVRYRDSVALGSPEVGSLRRGVKLPPEGRRYFTWDPVKRRSPSDPWRRWGTDDLVRTTLRIVRGYSRDHPRAPRVGIGDLSLPKGGYFGPEVSGGIGHATHQNGLDVDVYYPLRTGRERAPLSVDEIDMRLAQDLVDRFVAAGAEVIYVGPNTPLTGPPGVVMPLANHDNHLHARLPAP